MSKMIGEKVIIRANKAGVFFGTLIEKSGSDVILGDCRRLWYWDGAASISQLAVDGTKAPQNCKFTCSVSVIGVLDIIEIIPCTKKAINSINEVKAWEI